MKILKEILGLSGKSIPIFQQNSGALTFSQLAQICWDFRAPLFRSSVLVGIIVYLSSFFLPSFYAYRGLLKVPQMGADHGSNALNLPAGLSALIAQNLPTQGLFLNQEIKAFLDFKFVEQYRPLFSSSPHVFEVTLSDASNLVVIDVRATNLKEAEEFLQQVNNEIKGFYEKQVSEKISEGEKRIKLAETYLAEINMQLEQIEKQVRKVGFVETLALQDSELRKSRYQIQLEVEKIKVGLSDSLLSNAISVHQHPVKNKPIWPKPFQWTFLAAVLTFLIGVFSLGLATVSKRNLTV